MKREPQHGARPAEVEPLRSGQSGDPVLDEVGQWFAQVPPAEGLDQAGLARVARRLERSSDGRRKLWRSAALGLAFGAFASVSAAMWARYRASEHGVSSLTVRAAGEDERKAPIKGHTARAPTAAEVSSAPLAATSADPSAAPLGSASGALSARAAPGVMAAPSITAAPSVTAAPDGTLARESAALERALTALRRDHDAAGALTLLERYSADFPAGVLRTEADVARVDANLALGRQSAALAVLNRLPLEHVGRGQELELVRGELLATRDCRRANLDFDRVLAAHPAPSFDERALFGRASCRLELGDAVGGQADLRQYLARYPNGRFASAARDRLR